MSVSEETLAATIQIGELLVRSGIISQDLLEETNRLSFKMRLPFGRILTMHGHISEDLMSKAIEMQSRIRDQAVPLDLGLRVLNLLGKENIDIDKAIEKLTPKEKPLPVPTSNRLGEILMAAGFATPKQVQDAMIQSGDTGLPLGMVLVSVGIITRSNLNSALSAQRLIRLGVADRDRLIFCLKESRLKRKPLSMTLRENRIDPSPLEQNFGVGELLVMAGILSESQFLTAKEMEAVEGKPVEKCIVECHFASEPCVQTAAQLLKMIHEGMLFENQAAGIVKRIQNVTSYDELNQVLASIDEIQDEIDQEVTTVEVQEILQKAGLLSDKEIQIATALALSNRQPLLKTLVDAKLVNEKSLEYATQCKVYLDHNLIKIEQAAIAMVYAMENNISIDDTLDCFGWSAPVV